MKKLLLLIALFTACLTSFAQGNLQFNRVVNYNLTCTTPGSNIRVQQSISVTVPAGKVWKIESYHLSMASNSSSTSYFSPSGSTFDGEIVIDQAIVTNGSVTGSGAQSPIWLAAGNHTIILEGFANSAAIYIFYGLVTGIEFNVTQ